MAILRHLLRLNVGFIVNQPIGYNHDFHLEFPVIQLGSDLDLTEFKGVAHISRTPQGMLVVGDFRAKIIMECVRCLVDTEQELHTEFSELYAFKSRFTTETGLILQEDGNIDLEPLVREYFLVEIPIRPLCRSDCQGLCPICGEDLNQVTCEHQQSRENH